MLGRTLGAKRERPAMGPEAGSQPAAVDSAAVGEPCGGPASDPRAFFDPWPPFDLQPPFDPGLCSILDRVVVPSLLLATPLAYVADTLAPVFPLGTYRTFPSAPAALIAATGEYSRGEPLSQGFAAADENEMDADSRLGVDGRDELKDDGPADPGYAADGDPVDADEDLDDAV